MVGSDAFREHLEKRKDPRATGKTGLGYDQGLDYDVYFYNQLKILLHIINFTQVNLESTCCERGA